MILCSGAAFLISRFDPEKRFFWVGVIFGLLGIAGGIYLKIASNRKKKETCINIEPSEWSIDGDQYTKTCLIIPEQRHGKGADINLRVEFVGYDRYDLEPTAANNGEITIRYARNNYPANPRIPLRIYVSAR